MFQCLRTSFGYFRSSLGYFKSSFDILGKTLTILEIALDILEIALALWQRKRPTHPLIYRYIILTEIPSRLDINPPTPFTQQNTLFPIVMEVENHLNERKIYWRDPFSTSMIIDLGFLVDTCFFFKPQSRCEFFECLPDTRESSEFKKLGSVRVLCVWMSLCVCVFFFPPAVFGGSTRDSLHFRSLNFWRGGFYN